MRPYLYLIAALCQFVFVIYAFGAQLEGRVMMGLKPVEGARISAYESLALSEHSIQTQSDKGGYFKMSLDNGKVYFIEAQTNISGKLYKGFSGKNPVLANGEVFVGLKLLPVYDVKVLKKVAGEISVKGEVIADNKPLSGARVYFYLTRDFKGMPYIYSAPTDINGRFKVSGVVEGSYFVVARKKKDASPLGPVEEGDLIGFLSQNPVNMRLGYEYRIKIPTFVKEKDEAPSLNQVKEKVTIIGKVVDGDAKPVAGVYAFAYFNREMGHQRPVSISNKTGVDGTFQLVVPQKGRYYLGAREFYGGTPLQGELYGLYQGSFDHHIDLNGDLSGIEIAVKRILK